MSGHALRRNLFAALMVAGIVVWMLQNPLTPEQAFADSFPDAQVVAVQTVNGEQIWLHTNGDGEALTSSVLQRRWIAWNVVASIGGQWPLEGGVIVGSGTFHVLRPAPVAVYGYAPDPGSVLAVVVGEHRIELDGERYFLEVLPDGTPTGMGTISVELADDDI